MNNLPSPIIAIVSDLLYDFYTHDQLNTHFMYADAPGEPPDESKPAKIKTWLVRCNKTDGVDPFQVLGKFIEDFMEREMPTPKPFSPDPSERNAQWQRERETIKATLGKHGYGYFKGGIIRKAGSTGSTLTLEALLRKRDHAAIDDEFKRTMENIEADPPAALTGACAIVESLCKVYINAHDDLEMPKKQTISPLWEVVKKHLGLDPSTIEDQDLKKIITGTGSIVEGLGALRTHAGTVHGRTNETRYNLKPRHVRLAVHAAHTLVSFVLETWEERSH